MTTIAAVADHNFTELGLGLGETSAALRKVFSEYFEHREQSIVLGWRQALRNRITEVTHQEASEQGWDGYDAEPVTDLARVTACHLVGLLPESSLLPDVVPTPDGEIAFEWDYSKNYFFTVTTNQGSLIYAGILGADRKQYGQEPLGIELPQTIAKILGSYFSKA